MKYLPVSGRSCHHLGGEQAYFQLFAEQWLVIKLLRLFHYKFAGDCHDKVRQLFNYCLPLVTAK